MNMADFATVLWKEWKEILVQRSSGGPLRRAPLIGIAIVGILMPFRLGAAFFSPAPILGVISFSLMGVTIASVDAFAGERERHTLETLLASRLPDRTIYCGKTAACISYGWLLAIVCILVGTITVNLTHWDGRLLIFSDPASWLVLLLGPPLLSGLIASAGVLVSLRAPTVRQGQQTLMTGIMVVLIGTIFAAGALPAAWKAWFAGILLHGSAATLVLAGAGVVLALDLVLLLAGMTRFQRAKLVFD